MIDHRGVTVVVQQQRSDETRWLALCIRQGLLLICKAIEKRYGVGEHKPPR